MLVKNSGLRLEADFTRLFMKYAALGYGTIQESDRAQTLARVL